MATNPLLTDFRAEIMRYEDVNQMIDVVPNSVNVGPLQLITESIKSSLVVETKAWKVG